ncbi:hypothetical protein RhiirA5_402143 [Rhizophagus irregularis]|uniref:Uncharacterized protein n=1 Tax=Rhizophagus irregularis TaxID=588596 RepID=A0A2N0P845_9GLOM|nr:hypothetical protein RhiirA5_402143 [Rhizophagus irregularis]
MRSVDRVVVFEKIRALEERLDVIDNRLDTLFSSFYCSSESSSSESDYEPCKPTAPEKSVYLVMAKKSRNNRRKTAGMENDKKEESETRSDPKRASYASSSNNLPSDPEELTKVFEKNLEGLENLVKLFKSDVSKMFDISDPNFPSRSINASPEK